MLGHRCFMPPPKSKHFLFQMHKHTPSPFAITLAKPAFWFCDLHCPFSSCWSPKLKRCECQERKSGALEYITPLFSLSALPMPHMAHFMAAGEPDWWAEEQPGWCFSRPALGEVTRGKSKYIGDGRRRRNRRTASERASCQNALQTQKVDFLGTRWKVCKQEWWY